jgi:hypothetical protein
MQIMATLTELVDTIAKVEGVDRSRVNLIARYIREAGLIETGGRGSSAANMSVADAANLLIGVNAATNASDAARVVRKYRAFEAYEARFEADPTPASTRGLFGEAIEGLVEGACWGRLPEEFLRSDVSRDLREHFSRGHVQITLRFRKPDHSVTLRMSTRFHPDYDPTGDVSEEWREVGIGQTLFVKFLPPGSRATRKKKVVPGDRVEETAIGFRTIAAVGKLLRPPQTD